jgi:hypothetical protein
MESFWFTPRHQKEGTEVKFLLRGLDTRGLYTIQSSMGDRGVPDADAAFSAFESNVIGWEGVIHDGQPLPFSRVNRSKVLGGDASIDWMLWVAECSGKLYSKALLGDTEKKA